MANEVFVNRLRNLAFYSEVLGENPFKARALIKAAEILQEKDELEALVTSGEIKNIPGIGKGTQALVQEFLESGSCKEWDEVAAKFPKHFLELRQVRGLGAKKIKALWEKLQIGSLAELEYACGENRLVDLNGFGEKTQASILAQIEKLKAYRGKMILPAALEAATQWESELSNLEGVVQVSVTGELRRKMPVVASLDFLLIVASQEKLKKSLKKMGFNSIEESQWQKRSEDSCPVNIFLAHEKNFGSELWRTTGPDAYVRAQSKIAEAKSEDQVFFQLKLTPISPECRDHSVAKATLVEEKDICGVFHLHTTWSDGRNSLEEMAQRAVEKGYEYLGVSEHSQSAFYANGLDKKRILEQKKEIEIIQKKFPSLKIFQGIESDILADGSLDYPKDVLQEFDFVIASVHGGMKMPKQEMTDRLCRALENPSTTWLGHWTGRLLLGREGYEFDQEKVMKAAAQAGKGIELNSSPYRLDMDWTLLPKATALGIKIGIFPDAHSVAGLDDTKYGIWMARKAGLEKKDVINTLPLKEMEKWLQQSRA